MAPDDRGRVWIRITIHSTREAADAVASALLSVSPNGVTTEDAGDEVCVTGYAGPFHGADAIAGVSVRVRNALEPIPSDLLPRPLQIELSAEPEEDWIEAFRSHHQPVRIGHLVIKPTWEPWPSPQLPPRPRDLVIEIDPGLAFGTGQHPTTYICLAEMQERIRPGDRVLDFGCGSGILSIAAAKLGAGHITAIDCDEAALSVAAENVALNEVTDRVKLEAADNLDDVDGGLDLVVANINPIVVATEAARVAQLLRPGGTYICTGIPLSREGRVLEALREAPFKGILPRPKGEWIGFVCVTADGDGS
jgi:ribosomal protein L11 methyltransferase